MTTQVPYSMLSADLQGATYGMKNRIINGNFDFWQRGTSGTGAVYVADRWTTDQTNTTQARSTDVPSGIGADYSLQVSASSGTSATVQKVESKNVRDLSGQQVTVSFYAKAASGTPTLNFDVRYATALDNFASMTIMQGSTVTLSTTWTEYTFTFNALNSNVVNGLALFFYNVSTQTFLLSQVQLEKGSTATSFDWRPYGTELALCQRYAWNFNSANSSGGYTRFGSLFFYGSTGGNAIIKLPVTMRTYPALTRSAVGGFGIYYAGNVYTATAVDIGGDGVSPDQAVLNVTIASGGSSGGAGALLPTNNQTAYLLFTAEL